MVGKGKRGLLALCLALLGSVWSVLPAQNEDSGQVDSLLRLEKADYVEQLEAGDDLIRKVANPVFLHNGTYLQCDTSLWSRNTNIINCIGNVVMTQGDAVLTSDSLVYYVDDDLARFRGSLVELQNAEGNVLRTRELDYNTRDSLALFHNGASMRSEDGQIIESDEGSYSNPRNYFVFRDNVNMFTDSVFVRTNELDYDADAEFAMFKAPIDFWKEENMLSAREGGTASSRTSSSSRMTCAPSERLRRHGATPSITTARAAISRCTGMCSCRTPPAAWLPCRNTSTTAIPFRP